MASWSVPAVCSSLVYLFQAVSGFKVSTHVAGPWLDAQKNVTESIVHCKELLQRVQRQLSPIEFHCLVALVGLLDECLTPELYFLLAIVYIEGHWTVGS